MGISSIFNVADLYPYTKPEAEQMPNGLDSDKGKQIEWKKQIPTERKLQMEKILDTRLLKKTRGQEYYEYLIKWKDHPIEDATWVTNALI
jgi:hypothetical protein